jgi:hypothetical protein
MMGGFAGRDFGPDSARLDGELGDAGGR